MTAPGCGHHDLTVPMRDLLWRVAQHKYGWSYVSRHRGQMQVADALERRGLVYWSDRAGTAPFITATPEGHAEIKRRWSVSPFALDTYEDQPGGWMEPDGSQRGAVTRWVA